VTVNVIAHLTAGFCLPYLRNSLGSGDTTSVTLRFKSKHISAVKKLKAPHHLNSIENIFTFTAVLLSITKILNKNTNPNYLNKVFLDVLENNCFYRQNIIGWINVIALDIWAKNVFTRLEQVFEYILLWHQRLSRQFHPILQLYDSPVDCAREQSNAQKTRRIFYFAM